MSKISELTETLWAIDEMLDAAENSGALAENDMPFKEIYRINLTDFLIYVSCGRNLEIFDRKFLHEFLSVDANLEYISKYADEKKLWSMDYAEKIPEAFRMSAIFDTKMSIISSLLRKKTEPVTPKLIDFFAVAAQAMNDYGLHKKNHGADRKDIYLEKLRINISEMADKLCDMQSGKTEEKTAPAAENTEGKLVKVEKNDAVFRQKEYSLAVSDDSEELRRRIENTKNQIAELIQEKYDIIYYIMPKLQRIYDDNIGARIRRIMGQQLMMEELKRKITIMQAAINRWEKISVTLVDEQVQSEFKEYEDKQKEKEESARKEQEKNTNKQNTRDENRKKYEEKQNIGNDNSKISENVSQKDEFEGLSFKQKLKAIYKKLVKLLHPDVTKEFTEKEKNIWNEVQSAYADGDLDKLENIYEELKNSAAENIQTGEESILDLKNLLQKLLKQKSDLIAEIVKLKNTFPYTDKDKLENDEMLQAECEKYDAVIGEYEKEIQKLVDRIEKMEKKLRR